MQFRDAFHPTESELRSWAAQAEATEPTGDWELELAWGMESGRLRQFAELASDPSLPQSRFFLRALYQWVAWAAVQPDFETWCPVYSGWMEQVKGVRDPAVKQWRYHALKIFQRLESFDQEAWWEMFPTAPNGA